jgi:hypothetical protein
MEIHHQRFEEHTKREYDEWCAEEEPDGADDYDQPTVKNAWPLAGHQDSSRETGSVVAATRGRLQSVGSAEQPIRRESPESTGLLLRGGNSPLSFHL